jgi:FAD/FMN-containing dehydrogenase
MSRSALTENFALAAKSDLRHIRGRVVTPGDSEYDRVRTTFNSAVDVHPALLVLCETPQDVQAAVNVARKHSLPISVRGGGHDWAGRSLRGGGLVIDLSRMRRVEVDSVTRVATVQGGATSSDLASAAAAHGFIAVTAACGSVGITGLTLGGGYSPLSPKYGMAIDNLLSANLVLPNGESATASTQENTDLFWAIRGGGGNFGVVTSMQVQLWPHGKLLAGQIVFAWREAESVLQRYADLIHSMPDELAVLAGTVSLPDGAPAVLLAPTWCGDIKRGEGDIERLTSLGKPILTQVRPVALTDVLTMFDDLIGRGRDMEVQTRTLSDLSTSATSLFVKAMNNKTSPASSIVWHHFHGAPTRVPLSATPFGIRSDHLMVDIIATWSHEDARNGGIHRQWARDLSRALMPIALPGGYPNMLGPDEHAQIRDAYGINLGRLQELKMRFDPDGIFTSATTIPLASCA